MLLLSLSARRFFLATGLLLLTIVFAVSARAQIVTAEISGRVLDPSQAVIPNAKVTGRNLDTGFERTAVTDASGYYTLYMLPLGPYSVRVDAAGFQPVLRERIALSLGEKAVIDFAMKPATVSDTVTVTDEAPLIQTATAEVGKTIKTQSIDNLPLNGRDFAQLAALAPGVRTAGSSTTIRMSGQAYTSSSFKVDGMDNDSEFVSYRQARYTQDSISEVQVLTNQYSAEFGRSAGGIVNVITRSGTNTLHGRGFYYGRDESLDARNPFAAARVPFYRRQFGGTLGGPIIKDKTHFFGSVERIAENNTTFITTPTRTSWPLPTRALTAFGKVTQQINPNHSFNVNYNYDRIFQDGLGVGGIQQPDHAFKRTSTNNNLIFADTWLIGPRTVNDFRVMYQRRVTDATPLNSGPEIVRPSSITGRPVSAPNGWHENKIAIVENLTRSFNAAGQHSLKLGANLQFVRGDALIASFLSGQFIFTTDRPFNANDPTTFPSQYTIKTGNPTALLDNNIYAFYINDEWKVQPNLTLSFGLRYDVEAGPLVNVFPRDNNNFAPRLSFAWTPTPSRRTVLRGGYGRFFYRLYGNLGTNLFIDGAPPPFGVGTVNTIIIDNPSYPNPTAGTPRPQLKTGAFSDGTEQTPYSDQLSFGGSHQLGNNFAVTVDYVRVRGKHLPRPFDFNAPNPTTGVRPKPDFSKYYTYQTEGRTWYDAMFVTVEKRMSKGHQFLASYTLSSTKDDLWPLFISQAGAGPQSWTNIAAEKAYSATSGLNADDHERHRLVFSGLMHLPLGFRFSGIFTTFSKRRFNILTGRDNNNDATFSDRPNFDPTKAGNARYVDPGVGFNVAGNLERNAGEFSKNYAWLSLRLGKAFKLGERASIEVMLEAFNALNRTNFSSYQGNIRSAVFNQPIAAFDPRQMQFGAKFDF